MEKTACGNLSDDFPATSFVVEALNRSVSSADDELNANFQPPIAYRYPLSTIASIDERGSGRFGRSSHLPVVRSYCWTADCETKFPFSPLAFVAVNPPTRITLDLCETRAFPCTRAPSAIDSHPFLFLRSSRSGTRVDSNGFCLTGRRW